MEQQCQSLHHMHVMHVADALHDVEDRLKTLQKCLPNARNGRYKSMLGRKHV